jgi:hypothetical protein
MRFVDGCHSTHRDDFSLMGGRSATRDNCQLDDPSGWLIVLLTI